LDSTKEKNNSLARTKTGQAHTHARTHTRKPNIKAVEEVLEHNNTDVKIYGQYVWQNT
jgi:thiamine pyrophosphokinase